MTIVDRIKAEILPGTEIKKPQNKLTFTFKKWESRDGEELFVCEIDHPKGAVRHVINAYQFERAHDQLVNGGFLDRRWYERSMPECARPYYSPYTTIGGTFVLLGAAEYNRATGQYERTTRPERRLLEQGLPLGTGAKASWDREMLHGR